VATAVLWRLVAVVLRSRNDMCHCTADMAV